MRVKNSDAIHSAILILQSTMVQEECHTSCHLFISEKPCHSPLPPSCLLSFHLIPLKLKGGPLFPNAWGRYSVHEEGGICIPSQHPQPSLDCGFWSFVTWILSGNSLYSSTLVSCARAFLATVWKACSTLMASLALVSKYGISPLLWHQACALFIGTWKSQMSTSLVIIPKKYSTMYIQASFQGKKHYMRHLVNITDQTI